MSLPFNVFWTSSSLQYTFTSIGTWNPRRAFQSLGQRLMDSNKQCISNRKGGPWLLHSVTTISSTDSCDDVVSSPASFKETHFVLLSIMGVQASWLPVACSRTTLVGGRVVEAVLTWLDLLPMGAANQPIVNSLLDRNITTCEISDFVRCTSSMPHSRKL